MQKAIARPACNGIVHLVVGSTIIRAKLSGESGNAKSKERGGRNRLILDVVTIARKILLPTLLRRSFSEGELSPP
ncbi:MAG: hypothetical protein Q7S01_03155 [bacterium]|nr:hypothetical protein [bacterium]